MKLLKSRYSIFHVSDLAAKVDVKAGFTKLFCINDLPQVVRNNSPLVYQRNEANTYHLGDH